MTNRDKNGNDVLDELRDSYLRDIEFGAGTNNERPDEDDSLGEVFDLLRSTSQPAVIQQHDAQKRPSATPWRGGQDDNVLPGGDSDHLSPHNDGMWEWGDEKAPLDGRPPLSSNRLTLIRLFGDILSGIVTPGTISHLFARVGLALLVLWLVLAYVVPTILSMLTSTLTALMPSLIILVGIALCIKSVFR